MDWSPADAKVIAAITRQVTVNTIKHASVAQATTDGWREPFVGCMPKGTKQFSKLLSCTPWNFARHSITLLRIYFMKQNATKNETKERVCIILKFENCRGALNLRA